MLETHGERRVWLQPLQLQGFTRLAPLPSRHGQWDIWGIDPGRYLADADDAARADAKAAEAEADRQKGPAE